jgi:hypothetical protein
MVEAVMCQSASRDEGQSIKGLFSDAGCAVGDETLRRRTGGSGARRVVISNAKKTGACKKLHVEWRRVNSDQSSKSPSATRMIVFREQCHE